MTVDWYPIFNYDEFVALGLPSQELTVILEGIGEVDILVTKGNFVSVLYDGIFLPLDLNDRNPFAFEGHAIYKDAVDGTVWLGIEVEE